jgi:hypothetical protein
MPGRDDAFQFILERGGMARQRDIVAAEINPNTLAQMVSNGILEVPTRGVYRIASDVFDPWSDTQAIMLRTDGVLCMRSAAEFHGLTDQTHRDIWLAIPRHKAHDKADDLPVRFMKWGWERFPYPFEGMGVDAVQQEYDREFPVIATVGGAKLRVTSPERTVLDLLRYSCNNRYLKAQPDAAMFADEAFRILVKEKTYNERNLRDWAARLGVGEIVQARLDAHYAMQRH